MMPIEDFPEIPEFLRRRKDDPPAEWKSRPLAAVVAPAFGGIVRHAQGVDPGAERIRLETEQHEAQKRARALEKKRDDEAIRRRGLKNLKLIRLAAEGKIVLPPEPVKIVKVVDLTRKAEPAAEAATQETDVKKAAAKKARKGKTAKKAATPKKAKAAKKVAAAKPQAGKVDVVAQIAAMMVAPGGASMDEMVKATGIAAHPMRAKIKLVRDRLNYTTTAPCKENGYRYHAEAPKTAAKGMDQ